MFSKFKFPSIDALMQVGAALFVAVILIIAMVMFMQWVFR
jgi:flagellar biogenesis protein FliO